MQQFSKVLIVKPSSLGDVVHSLAFINALKNSYPDAVIHWVISRGLEGLIDDNPMVNTIWTINKDTWKEISQIHNTLTELTTLFKSLKAEKFDLVVDLQGLLRSAIISWSTKAPRIVGFKEAREGSRVFYTESVEGGGDIHAVDRYLKIANYLGCNTSTVQFPLPVSPHSVRGDIQNLLSDEYAVIVPGARWPTKRWYPEGFGAVASQLPVRFYILGGKEDTEIANVVAHHSRGNAVSLAGKTTLKELILIVQHSRFMLTNDTGPMHIAAALNVPVFAIFGPTDSRRTGPYGKNHIIIRSEISCSPCFRKKCKTPDCLRQISPQRVIETIKENI